MRTAALQIELPLVTPTLVVATARKWLGTPYHHQSAVRGAGCDCLGLVRGVYAELYGVTPEEPPAYTMTWGEYGKEELMLEAARRHLMEVSVSEDGHTLALDEQRWLTGDVLLFRARIGAVAKHCCIVSGEDTMIHSYSGIGVAETSIGIWKSRAAGVFKFPGI
jgi:NlpC/P60 family putative phage cell wall peptidase